MLSYTERRNLFGSLATQNTEEVKTLGDKLMDIAERKTLGSKKWKFLQKAFTVLTDSAAQFVTLPQYVDKVTSITVLIGTTTYQPHICTTREEWDRVNQVPETSDIPRFAYVYDGQVGLFPKPATSSNVITINSKVLRKTLSIADYTTGGILTAVVGSQILTGISTVWTAAMAGRWIKITKTDLANKGDGIWYQILSVQSNTSLTLVRKYAGDAITAGNAAYAIGECSVLPEDFQHLPVWGGLRTYYISPDPDSTQGAEYAGMYNDDVKAMEQDHLESENVLQDGEVENILEDNGHNL